MRTKKGREGEIASGEVYADAPERPNIQQRVEYMAALMAANRYHSYSTIKALSVRWGLAMETLHKDSSTASRMLRIPPERLEELRARLASSFETIALRALSIPNCVTGLPDWKAAIDALERFGRYAGLRIDAEEPAGAQRDVVVKVICSPEPDSKSESSPPDRDPG